MFRKWLAALLLLVASFWVVEVYARGGQAADDCPPHSKDPDCVGGK